MGATSETSKFSLKAYVDLCRISNLPTIWTNVLAGMVLSDAALSWRSFFLVAFSMSLFYSGGMSLNDIFDSEWDRAQKNFRPIPSARVPLAKAWQLTAGLFSIGLLLILFVPNPASFSWAIVLLILIAVYDGVHKKFAITVLLMGGCRVMVYLIASLSVSGKVNNQVAAAGMLQFSYIVLLSALSRYEDRFRNHIRFPLIPLMLCCICLIDGAVMAFFRSSFWLAAGVGGAVLTRLGQRTIRGD